MSLLLLPMAIVSSGVLVSAASDAGGAEVGNSGDAGEYPESLVGGGGAAWFEGNQRRKR